MRGLEGLGGVLRRGVRLLAMGGPVAVVGELPVGVPASRSPLGHTPPDGDRLRGSPCRAHSTRGLRGSRSLTASTGIGWDAAARCAGTPSAPLTSGSSRRTGSATAPLPPTGPAAAARNAAVPNVTRDCGQPAVPLPLTAPSPLTRQVAGASNAEGRTLITRRSSGPSGWRARTSLTARTAAIRWGAGAPTAGPRITQRHGHGEHARTRPLALSVIEVCAGLLAQ